MESAVILPPDYVPSPDEEYMNDLQVEYFRQKLLAWKKSLLNQSQDTLEDLRQGGLNQPDDIDRASMETDKALDLRTKDRARKLISKINDALKRIEDGTYGYCEETGEPIGLSAWKPARLPHCRLKPRNATNVWKKLTTTKLRPV